MHAKLHSSEDCAAQCGRVNARTKFHAHRPSFVFVCLRFNSVCLFNEWVLLRLLLLARFLSRSRSRSRLWIQSNVFFLQWFERAHCQSEWLIGIFWLLSGRCRLPNHFTWVRNCHSIRNWLADGQPNARWTLVAAIQCQFLYGSSVELASVTLCARVPNLQF